jgi:hypothetical protein
MPKGSAKVNKTEEIIADLLCAAEKLRAEGEREAACCCIEAVFVLLGQQPRRNPSHVAWADELNSGLLTH